MKSYKNILVIIPARGGSKSIPQKNVKILGNKPLIAYPIELAKSIGLINKIIVSTDDQEISEIAKRYGVEIPFLRPAELAKDDTPTLPVLQHCICFLEQNQNYKADIIVLLYPTCPFLRKETVEESINILIKEKCNSVISVEEDYGRFWVYKEKNDRYVKLYPKERVNRQYYKPLYKENGAIYFSKYKTIMIKNKLIDDKSLRFVLMKPNEVVDLDTIDDWKKAEDRTKSN